MGCNRAGTFNRTCITPLHSGVSNDHSSTNVRYVTCELYAATLNQVTGLPAVTFGPTQSSKLVCMKMFMCCLATVKSQSSCGTFCIKAISQWSLCVVNLSSRPGPSYLRVDLV